MSPTNPTSLLAAARLASTPSAVPARPAGGGATASFAQLLARQDRGPAAPTRSEPAPAAPEGAAEPAEPANRPAANGGSRARNRAERHPERGAASTAGSGPHDGSHAAEAVEGAGHGPRRSDDSEAGTPDAAALAAQPPMPAPVADAAAEDGGTAPAEGDATPADDAARPGAALDGAPADLAGDPRLPAGRAGAREARMAAPGEDDAGALAGFEAAKAGAADGALADATSGPQRESAAAIATPAAALPQAGAAASPHASFAKALEAARGEAPAATVHIPAPLASAEFVPALGTRLAVLAHDGVQQAELQIHPPELGPISVQIALDGAQVTVDFAADIAGTRERLERGLPELAATLQENGLTLAGGGVHDRSGGAAHGGRGGAGSGRGARGDADGRALGGVAPADAAALASPRAARTARGALDVFA